MCGSVVIICCLLSCVCPSDLIILYYSLPSHSPSIHLHFSCLFYTHTALRQKKKMRKGSSNKQNTAGKTGNKKSMKKKKKRHGRKRKKVLPGLGGLSSLSLLFPHLLYVCMLMS